MEVAANLRVFQPTTQEQKRTLQCSGGHNYFPRLDDDFALHHTGAGKTEV